MALRLLHIAAIAVFWAGPAHAQSAAPAAFRLTVAPRGNHVRYRVQEQLADMELPSDAVGGTDRIAGAIVFDQAGRVLTNASKLTIDVRSLKSDRSARDTYVNAHILDTGRFPTVTLVPLSVKGPQFPLPSTGEQALEVLGNLTIDGVTRVTTWKGKANFDGKRIVGTVTTTFTFDEFNLKKPNVLMVLSADDDITLEYDFTLLASK
jgi:polyisoprenoid-binding protein YceI